LRHSLQTSDALGAASTHLGPQAVAVIVLLNKYLGLLARQDRDVPGPTYGALREAIRASPVVSPDETSWKVGGRLQWLWACWCVTAARRTGGSSTQHIKPVWCAEQALRPAVVNRKVSGGNRSSPELSGSSSVT
jgi:hypothetical protein